MSETSSAYELRNAMTEAGCPVCRLKARDGKRYLDSLLDESVNDLDVRRDLRESRGFCHRHAWQLVRPGAPLGIAIIHRDIIQAVLKALKGASFQKPPLISVQRLHEAVDAHEPAAATAGLVERLGPKRACPACRLEGKMEGIYLSTLVENLGGEKSLLEGFKSSAGLCLPHLRRALALVRDRAAFEALVGAQRDIWRQLEADLGEFVRKSDYRFHEESLEVEGDAWLRGIAAVSGNGTEVET